MTAANHNFLEVLAARLQAVRRDRRHIVPPPPPAAAEEEKEYLTWEEAAEVARVCVKTLRSWGVPRSKPNGGRVLIKRTELDKFLEERRSGGDDADR